MSFNSSNYPILIQCLDTYVILTKESGICTQLINLNFIEMAESLLVEIPLEENINCIICILTIYHHFVKSDSNILHITNILSYTCDKIQKYSKSASVLKAAFLVLSDIEKSDTISINMIKEMNVANDSLLIMKRLPDDEKLQIYVLKTFNTLVSGI